MGSHQILSMMEDGDPRRGSLRRRVLLSAKLATTTGEWAVRIRDISATGARLEAGDLPRVNAAVVLKRGTFLGFGRLIWANGGAGGILFDEPLEEEELLDSLKGLPSAPPVQDSYRRPGLNRGDARVSDGRGWVDLPGRD